MNVAIFDTTMVTACKINCNIPLESINIVQYLNRPLTFLKFSKYLYYCILTAQVTAYIAMAVETTEIINLILHNTL